MSANQPTRLKNFGETDPKIWEEPVLEVFRKAANNFVRERLGETRILAASMDWFTEEWGRDTLISLPGLLLVNSRFDEARSVLRRLVRFENNGLLPNVISEKGISYNSADASLWLFYTLNKYITYTNDWTLVKEFLPTIRRILRAYIEGTGYYRYGKFQRIFVDKDGLVVSPPQATWMDADAYGRIKPVTPRNGKAVEINALFYASLSFLKRLEAELEIEVRGLEEMLERTKSAFNDKFWDPERKVLYDVIEGDPHGNAIRPNMVIAAVVGGDLLSIDRKIAVFERTKAELLTPGGLRTLAPSDPKYVGSYDTYAPVEVKDLAYHQGTAWPWLMGFFCDLLVEIRRYEEKSQQSIKEELRWLLAPLVTFCLESPYHSLPELFSGDLPHEPGGTRSQAWSVAEVLRVILEYELV